MSYSILRIGKLKKGGTKGMLNHTLRLSDTKNANPEKLNKRWINDRWIEIQKKPEAMSTVRNKVVEDIKQKVEPLKKRPDSVYGLDILMTSDEKYFEKVDPDRWATDSVQWLEQTFGKENLDIAVIHLDEKTPHIQAHVTPAHKGWLSARHWINGKKALSDLQDSYNQWMVSKHHDLKRGDTEKKARHTDVKDFYKKVNRKTPTMKLPEPGGIFETKTEYKKKIEEMLNSQDLDTLTAKSAHLDTIFANLPKVEEEIQELQKTIRWQKEQLKNYQLGGSDKDRLKREINALEESNKLLKNQSKQKEMKIIELEKQARVLQKENKEMKIKLGLEKEISYTQGMRMR